LNEKCNSLEKKVKQLREEEEEKLKECKDIVEDIHGMRSRLDREKRNNEQLTDEVCNVL